MVCERWGAHHSFGGAAAWPVRGARSSASAYAASKNDPVAKPREPAFTQALADLRWAGEDINLALARELVGLQPDIILTNGIAATAAVQRETRTIPIVFMTG